MSQYINSIKAGVSEGNICWRILTTIPKNVSFWLALVQIVAGGCTFRAVYYPFQYMEMTLVRLKTYFSREALGWFSTSCYVLLEDWKAAGAMFDQLEESKVVLKKDVLPTANEVQTKHSENCRGYTTTWIATARTKRRHDHACMKELLFSVIVLPDDLYWQGYLQALDAYETLQNLS